MSRPFLAGALALTAALAAGCGGPVAQKDLDAARDAVQAALEAWQRGERSDALKARPTPVEFSDDDWQRGVRLSGFSILKIYGLDDGAARCTVRLTLLGRNGRPVEKEVTYQVNPGARLVVARDPYS